MIFCKELNKNFESKKELFKALKTNAKEIISLKKAQVLKSCDKGLSVVATPMLSKVITDSNKSLNLDDNFYYVAVNSTRVLDSHKDLHLDGIWNKTVKEQQGKNYLVADHKLELDKVIAKKEHIKMFTATIPFSALGKSYEGDTEALIYQIPKDKVNESFKDWLEGGEAIEASVRMQYVTIALAMNSEEVEYEEERKEYLTYHPLIANKDEFENIDYFWTVKEAKNLRESSLVLFGSNSSTGILDIKVDAETITSTKEEAETITSKQVELLTRIKI